MPQKIWLHPAIGAMSSRGQKLMRLILNQVS